jgi:CO/xanthine dehydrogenase FAD-binding subunit
MTSHVPAGWPEAVRPPPAPDWELSAAAFLFDCCPADFRAYPVLRRHPLVLARFAAHFVAGQCRAAQEGLAEIRTSLQGRVPVPVVEAAVEAWLEQEARLVRTRRAVRLVEDALSGQEFRPRL